MTVALFIHADPKVGATYETALGVVPRFVNAGGFSASYDEHKGLASTARTLNAALAKYLPARRADDQVVLLCFSAGCWAGRAWLRDQAARDACAAVVLIDGLHSSTVGPLQGVIEYARAAVVGRGVFVLTHSQITPPYASTRDTADLVLHELGLERANRQASVHAGGFHLLAGTGADAAAHVWQLTKGGPEACREYVLPALREHAPTEPPPPVLVMPPGERRPLRERALQACLDEAARWGNFAPPPGRIAEYMSGCERGGHRLGLTTGNHCAAAQGWAELASGEPGEVLPPWRAAAKEVAADARAGLRGRWYSVEDIRAGYRPPPGALAIYHRGAPGAWTGHIDRVIVSEPERYECIGANESGRRWEREWAPFAAAALLGFVVDDEAQPPDDLTLWDEPPAVPPEAVEPPLLDQERAILRGVLALSLADAGREAVDAARLDALTVPDDEEPPVA